MKRIQVVCVLLAGILTTLAVQCRNGYYTTELGIDPDEPAHAVTSLMIREYLATDLPGNPIRFANDYYEHYPKVALGHYPPVFYLVAGLWLLPAPSVAALGWPQALLTALLILTCASIMARRMPWWLAACLSTSWSLMPLMQKQSSQIMADTLLALLCLLCVLAWVRFAQEKDLRWSLLFGFLAASAILTKGSGWMLALVPILHIALTSSWGLLKNWRLWLAPLPVAILALPWQIYSARITARGMSDDATSTHFTKALAFYSETLPRTISYSICAVLIISIILLIWRWRMQKPTHDQASLWALVAANIILITLVPAGLTSRYLMPMFFPAMILATTQLWEALHTKPVRFYSALGVLLGILIFTTPAPPPRVMDGYEEALQGVKTNEDSDKDIRLLVVSDARGEGAVVAAAAFGLPKMRVLRASKTLAEQDWLDRGYKAKAATPEAILALLDKEEVDWVFLDATIPHDNRDAYHSLVTGAMGHATRWKLIRQQAISRYPNLQGQLAIYHRLPEP